jgi:hypothetical protein
VRERCVDLTKELPVVQYYAPDRPQAQAPAPPEAAANNNSSNSRTVEAAGVVGVDAGNNSDARVINIKDGQPQPDGMMAASDLPMVPMPSESGVLDVDRSAGAGAGANAQRGDYTRLSVVSLSDDRGAGGGGRGGGGGTSSSASEADDVVASGVIRVRSGDESKDDGDAGDERKHSSSAHVRSNASVVGVGVGGAGAGVGGRPRIHNDSCAVCLEDFAHLAPVKLLPCAHGFHPECIDPWLNNRSDQCPICKASILEGLEAQRRNQQCCKNFLRCFCCLRNLNV